MGKYDDIINLKRPKSSRPRMPIGNRAKIFMPFAALKGYDDMIKKRHKLVVERKLLSEERKEELDETLHYLEYQIKSGKLPEVTVQYFIPDDKISIEEGKKLGTYEILTGNLEKIDSIFKQIRVGGHIIYLEDIVNIIQSTQ